MDFWVALGYVLCVASVAFCCVYAWKRKDEKEDDEE